MLTGLNHLTLSVRDLDASLVFYADILGGHLAARWKRGAYLEIGTVWLCLTLENAPAGAPASGYTHIAFTIPQDALPVLRDRLRRHGIPEWKENTSEGDSVYFTDPDGHQLEVHAGNLASRLAACRAQPYEGMVFYPQGPGTAPSDPP